MQYIEYYGAIVNGVLDLPDREALIADLKIMGNSKIKLTIERVYDDITRPTMNYYWKVIVGCFQKGMLETNGERLTRNDAHLILKQRCNIESLSKLNSIETSEYFDNCIDLIENYLNVKVPEPKKPS